MKIGLFAACFGVCAMVFAAEPVRLPKPEGKGGMALSLALAQRHSVRKFTEARLSMQQLGDLLWAANGVNRADGRRTAPSAMNRQDVDLYALTADGNFRYEPATHSLIPLGGEPALRFAGNYTAPVYVVLVINGKKSSGRYAAFDAGMVSENIYLHCTAAGLGTCVLGSVAAPQNAENLRRLRKALQLADADEVIASHCVGIPQ